MISNLLERLADTLGLALPTYGMAAALVLVLYGIQSELRFGARARSHSAGSSDRGTSLAVSIAALVPVVGFVLAMSARAPTFLGRLTHADRLSAWLFAPAPMPGMPMVAWTGVLVGGLGLAIRLWAVLTLRHRYTRTLLVQDGHAIERRGPYRFVRHPGYLGSLLCLNGIALASGSLPVFVAALVATQVAYAYRIHVEDAMLVAAMGPDYDTYRKEVGALLPFLR